MPSQGYPAPPSRVTPGRRMSAAPPCRDRGCAPQRPRHEHWLQQKPEEAALISVQHGRRSTRLPLVNVPGKYRDEERRDSPSHALTLPWKRNECCSEHDFDGAGCDDDCVFVCAQHPCRPVWNGDAKTAAPPCQVTNSCGGDEDCESPTGDVFQHPSLLSDRDCAQKSTSVLIQLD